MKYQPPFGSTDPGESYVDRNLASGIQGSRVSAKAIEHHQRELHHLIQYSGQTPSDADLEQVRKAVQTLAEGRLLSVRLFTASTVYTPTPGTKTIVVEAIGGGGSGGGASVTGAGQVSVGAGGGAGSYVKARLASGFDSVPVTVAGSVPGGQSLQGAVGQTTSFGALLTATGGGYGGILAGTNLVGAIGGTGSAAPSGGTIANVTGSGGGVGVSLGNGIGYSGVGASSLYGTGGGANSGSSDGLNAAGYGAGGGGGYNAPSQSMTRKGGSGGPGLVVVWEYA